MNFLNTFGPFVLAGAAILHGIGFLVHSFITLRRGADHAVLLDKAVELADKLASITQSQAQAAAQNAQQPGGGA